MPHYFKRDDLDGLFYGWAWDDSPELQGLEKALGRELLEDLHASLLRPAVEPDPATSASHASTLAAMTETAEWQALRAECQGDEARALLGTLALARALKDKLPKDRPTPAPRGAASGRALPLDASDLARQVARVACRVASAEVQDAVETQSLLIGQGTGEGAGRKTDRSALVTASQGLARSRRRGLVSRILEQAGRMTRIMRSVRAAKTRRGPGAIVGIETSGEVARALPAELAALAPGAHPGLRLDFLKRLAAREILSRKMEASENVGRGPIVVCLDESGSMEGLPEVWSKGLVLTLMRLAAEERRAFAFVPFSSRGEVRVWKFEGQPPSVETLIACLEWQWNGGTDFQTPLDEALRCLESSALNKADIVFVTDGGAGIDPRWEADFKARIDAKGARLWSILLMGEGYPSTLDPISSGAVRVPDMNDDGDALELAFSVGLS